MVLVLEQIIILTKIIFIYIFLASYNAIIIGLIAANFNPKHRKQIILWGVAGALVFKVILQFLLPIFLNFILLKY